MFPILLEFFYDSENLLVLKKDLNSCVDGAFIIKLVENEIKTRLKDFKLKKSTYFAVDFNKNVDISSTDEFGKKVQISVYLEQVFSLNHKRISYL